MSQMKRNWFQSVITTAFVIGGLSTNIALAVETNAAEEECGEDSVMNIDQRIQDCATTKTFHNKVAFWDLAGRFKKGGVWSLVARIESSGEMKEVWQTPDRVLVSDTLENRLNQNGFTFAEAKKECAEHQSEQKDALGNISGNWTVPTAYYDNGKNRDGRNYNPHNEDRLSYNHLEALGIRDIVPNIKDVFWSSSSGVLDYARVFGGSSDVVYDDVQGNRNSVRCVLGR